MLAKLQKQQSFSFLFFFFPPKLHKPKGAANRTNCVISHKVA